MYMQVNDENGSPRRIPGLDLRGTGYCPNLNFRRTARAVTRLFDLAFQNSGVRSTQFTILVAVAKTQPSSISALSNVLLIDSTTLTRSLRLLQKEGWLSVSARSTKRQRFVNLTPLGQQVLARTVPLWRKAQEQFVDTVGRDYWLNLRSELERLAHVAVDLEKSPGDPKSGPTVTQ
jgi:DNA-binding MarR family transcriptional regulator